MSLTTKSKILISIASIFVIAAIVTPSIVVPISIRNNTIKFTLLDNAGVMIENGGVRVYIDPYNLPEEYEKYPADAILVTHIHEDHYDPASIDLIKKDSTIFVFPAMMYTALITYDSIAVNPEDEFQIKHIDVTAFYMYTFPAGAITASHPKEANFTSYILDINGFTIFHAGDSKNIEEYNELVNQIDLALLPLGPGCQTMADEEVYDVLQLIKPKYFIPIHYALLSDENFIIDYGDLLTDCELIHLEYFTSYRFKI